MVLKIFIQNFPQNTKMAYNANESQDYLLTDCLSLFLFFFYFTVNKLLTLSICLFKKMVSPVITHSPYCHLY